MPDGAPQTGQRVWRISSGDSDFADVYDGDDSIDAVDRASGLATPGVWHSLDPKALIDAQNRVASRIAFDLECSIVDADECAWNVFAILGLTPPEPKEGGAS